MVSLGKCSNIIRWEGRRRKRAVWFESAIDCPTPKKSSVSLGSRF